MNTLKILIRTANVSKAAIQRFVFAMVGVFLVVVSIQIINVGNQFNKDGVYMGISAEQSKPIQYKNDEKDIEVIKNSQIRDISTRNSFDIVNDDFELIKSGDKNTIKKYFGDSVELSGDIVADRVSATYINAVSEKRLDSHNVKLTIQVKTIDYTKMNNDFNEIMNKIQDENNKDTEAKKQITKNLIGGEYDVKYNVLMNVIDNQIIVNESYKQAITGGWYTGVGVKLDKV